MPEHPKLSGVFAPAITPFAADLSPDPERFIRHCRWLVGQDCGLAVFGTNSEANSLSVDERAHLLDVLIDADLPPGRIMPGTGCCALPDTVRLSRQAAEHGCAGVLMLPPFYYKGVSSAALLRYYSEVIERVADKRLRVYLYHIPQVSGIGIELDLIEALLKAYPGTIAGLKDSSGDWHNTLGLLRTFPDLAVFSGSEVSLLDNLRNAGAGCISATANINPAPMVHLFRHWQAADADDQQAGLTSFRVAIAQFPMIAALKHSAAFASGDSALDTVRPPLMPLDTEEIRRLESELTARSFRMPGYGD